jgi:hypothetical protein
MSVDSTKLPYHPRQGERVEWDMNCTTHHGLYVEWLPFPEVMRCNHRVVSEEYGLLTFEDNGTLRPAKATVQSGGDLRDLANAVIADAGKGFSRGGTVPPAWQKPVKLARRVLAMLDDAGQSERPKCEQCGDKGWIDGHGPEEDCKCGLVQAACPDCRPEQYCALCGKEIVNELCHTNTHGHKPVAKPTVQANDDTATAITEPMVEAAWKVLVRTKMMDQDLNVALREALEAADRTRRGIYWDDKE